MLFGGFPKIELISKEVNKMEKLCNKIEHNENTTECSYCEEIKESIGLGER